MCLPKNSPAFDGMVKNKKLRAQPEGLQHPGVTEEKRKAIHSLVRDLVHLLDEIQ
jgi:hypothetical protein